MKTYARTDARTARKLSIASNRDLYEDQFKGTAPRTAERAAARATLETYDLVEPILQVIAGEPVAAEAWWAVVRAFNQAIEAVAARSVSRGPRIRKSRLAATVETPGTTPDFRAGRDL